MKNLVFVQKPKKPTRREVTRMLNKLPLSELLRVAVADARRAIRNPNVLLNMMDWVVSEQRTVRGEKRTICSVCMAGAVLYCKLEERDYSAGFDVPKFARDIDIMRCGQLPERAPRGRRINEEIRDKFYEMVRGWRSSFNNNRDGGRALLKDYLKAATYLESQGF